MPTLTAKFFDWARSPARETDRANIIPVTSTKIAGILVQDKTLFLGNVKQLRDGFNDFLFGVCRAALDTAGRDHAGVAVDQRYVPAVARLFSEFLSKGHSRLPAFGWVIPVTSSLAAHTGGNGATNLEATQFGIDPVHGKLFVPLSGAGHHQDFGIELRTRDFPWVMPECQSLALIPRIYRGNGFCSWRRQYTIASFADSEVHRQFFRENDLVVAHAEAIVRDETDRSWHSRNPLICCGRLRPYPKDVADGWEHPYHAIFDYIALVLDARSRGIISVSFLSVDFEHWIRFWSDVGDAIRDIVAPGLVDPGKELTRAIEFERCRRIVLKEVEGWKTVYKASWEFRPGIDRVLEDVLHSATNMPGWERFPNKPATRGVDGLGSLDALTWGIAHAEGFGDYESSAASLLDIRAVMMRCRESVGFLLPD